MDSVFEDLYSRIASRKRESEATGPYTGGNGRIDRAADLIRSGDLGIFGGSSSLLDVGGATGNLGYSLRDMFLHRAVMDISSQCREPAESKGNTFICRNVDESGFADICDRSVSLVTALDFIEHILDPERFARESFRILEPGGVVLINTPNIQYWPHLARLVVDGVFPHTSGDQEVYHGGHLAFYNLHDMEEIFIRRAGFVDGRMHTRGLIADPPPPIWLSICGITPPERRLMQLSYADLIFSCRRPLR